MQVYVVFDWFFFYGFYWPFNLNVIASECIHYAVYKSNIKIVAFYEKEFSSILWNILHSMWKKNSYNGVVKMQSKFQGKLVKRNSNIWKFYKIITNSWLSVPVYFLHPSLLYRWIFSFCLFGHPEGFCFQCNQ